MNFIFKMLLFFLIFKKEFKMKNKVKWFSKEKGYGFITDKENNDLYFGVQDIIGPDLPEHGDIVEYEFKKIPCNSCGIDVEPKLWHYGGSDFTNVQTQYLCPHCGNSLLKTGGGFNLYAKSILGVFSIIIVAIIALSWF